MSVKKHTWPAAGVTVDVADGTVYEYVAES